MLPYGLVTIEDRVARLLTELPSDPQFPTQGATLFVDLARRQVRQAYTPRRIIEAFLAGRGANMFYLYRFCLLYTSDAADE